jgi:hypothetical protein
MIYDRDILAEGQNGCVIQHDDREKAKSGCFSCPFPALYRLSLGSLMPKTRTLHAFDLGLVKGSAVSVAEGDCA